MKRIEATKNYLVQILDDLNKKFNIINYDFLSSEVDYFSLDKIPTKSKIEETITGNKEYKDVFNFRGRFAYGSDVAQNLSNIGFWEDFEDIIESNNEEGILPLFDGVKAIYCLNCGSVQRANTQDCEMSIQIEIDYEKRRSNL